LFKESNIRVSNNNISNGDTNKQVQDRLLDVAERLFCEKGFDGTSVRDITSQAKCNVAAVNYYFGGKENLYNKVFHRRMRTLCEVRIASINRIMSQGEGEVTLERLLRAFAMAFVKPLIDESSGRRFLRLMISEMSDLHLPQSMFLEEVIIPVLTALQQALAKVCPDLGRAKAMLVIHSVIGQLLHVVHLFNLGDEAKLPRPGLVEMVEHIVEFSAAGIRAAVKDKTE